MPDGATQTAAHAVNSTLPWRKEVQASEVLDCGGMDRIFPGWEFGCAFHLPQRRNRVPWRQPATDWKKWEAILAPGMD